MNDRQWRRKEHDHGAALAADAGFTPVYLHYNSGLHVSINGRAFAGQLEALLGAWPVPVDELVILGHSMGGLLARSACYYGELAGHAWPRHLRKIVFLGTPHHGTAFERGGNWVTVALGVSRYTAAFARLGKIRSAGITDLRYGSLLDEDWEDRDRFARDRDTRRILPLSEGVQCYAIAAAIPTGESVPERAAPRRRTRAVAQRARPAPGPGPEPAIPGVTAVDRLRHEPLGPARSRRGVRADPRMAGSASLIYEPCPDHGAVDLSPLGVEHAGQQTIHRAKHHRRDLPCRRGPDVRDRGDLGGQQRARAGQGEDGSRICRRARVSGKRPTARCITGRWSFSLCRTAPRAGFS